MKKDLGKILNLVVIVGTLIAVIVIGLTSKDLSGAVKSLSGVGLGWVLLCVVGCACNVATDALALWYFLRRQGCHVHFLYMMFVSVSGLYYSNITPGATGGQPMQVYYLAKKGVPMGLATSALVVRFFSFQFMLSVVAAIAWIRYPVFIEKSVGEYKWFMVLGFCYNTVMVAGIVLLVFKREWIRKGVRALVKLGHRVHLVKDPEKTLARADVTVDTFVDSISMFKERKLDLVVQLVIGAVQLLCQMTILYFIYLSLGLRTATWGQVVAVDIMEYVSAAYMPLPGASGASEVTFSLYFSHLFQDEGLCFAALMLWRFFTYYFMLLVGMVVTMAYGWRAGEGAKAVLKQNEQRKAEWEASLAEEARKHRDEDDDDEDE